VEKGAKVNEGDSSGETPLHVLMKHGDSSEILEICDLLIKGGADVHARNGVGQTPLHVAAKYGSVKGVQCLVENGAKMNEQDAFGQTPLHWANKDLPWRPFNFINEHEVSTKSHFERLERAALICLHFVKSGAEVTAKDLMGRTALYWAVQCFNWKACKILLEQRVGIICDIEGNSPLHWVCNILESTASSGEMPALEQEKLLRLLHDAGIHIDVQNRQGETPLHRAVRLSNSRMVKYLLDHDASKHVANKFQQTPLHVACERGLLKMASNILRHRQDRQYQNDIYGNSPLHYVFMLNFVGFFRLSAKNRVKYGPKAQVSYVREFAKSNFNLNVQNSSGWQPLHLACYSYDFTDFVVELLAAGCDVNARLPATDKTPLMIACEHGYEKICRLLLTQASLDRDARDRVLGTALDWACEFDQYEICKMLLNAGFDHQSEQDKARLLGRASYNNSEQLWEVLCERWQQWDTCDDEGNTVLHYACMEGYAEVVKNLIRRFGPWIVGAVIRNKAGKTPLECARLKGYEDIVMLPELQVGVFSGS
jgi:ankyrin repeat protein